jgi:DNA-binding SARP family transcriptional activator
VYSGASKLRQFSDVPWVESPRRSTSPIFRLILLGPPRLEQEQADGTVTPVIGPGKPLALLAYLALAPGRNASRDKLCDQLWGDKQIETARASLRNALWSIRRDTGVQLLHPTGDSVRADPALVTDVAAFEAAIEEKDFERALDIYRGDLFAEYGALGADRFEAWAALEAVRLRSMALTAIDALARRALNAGRFRAALALAVRYRGVDPHAEAGWRLSIETHLAAGDGTRARADADYFEEWLKREGRTPEAASVALLRTVRRPPPDEGDDPHSLAAELVDRERQFTAIQEEWRLAKGGEPRWIHISASTGLGKTRLITDAGTRIRAARDRVVSARANPGERAVSLTLAATLASRLATLGGASGISTAAAGILMSLDPRLAANWPGAVTPARIDNRGVALALLELISAVAEDRPLAIFIDDLHWADADSSETLAVMGSRLEGNGVLVVTTARPRYRLPPLPEQAIHLELQPLTHAAVEQCVASIAALPPADWTVGLIDALVRGCAGNPLAILETLRLCIDEGTLTRTRGEWVCPDPQRLASSLTPATALDRRLKGIDAEARRLLEVMAVAGLPLSSATAARASGIPEETVATAAAMLEQRGFLLTRDDSWMLAHDSVEEAVVASMTDAELRDAHRVVGKALAGETGSERRAARHLTAAEEWGAIAGIIAPSLRSRSPFGLSVTEEISVLLGEGATSETVGRVRRHLPMGVRLRPRLAAGGVGAAALIVTAALIPRLWSGSTEPPSEPVLVVAMTGADGSVRVSTAPLDREHWDATRPIVVSGGRVERGWPRSVPPGALIPRPGSIEWAMATASADSGEGDVALVDGAGRTRRITWQPGLDRPGGFSPDGSQMAMLMTRGHPRRWSRVAILDLATGGIRELTNGPGTEERVQWSPDGSRLAFMRDPRDGTPVMVCTILVDGSGEECVRIDDERDPLVLGWLDPARVIVAAAAEGTSSDLLTLDLRDGSVNRLRAGLHETVVTVDPSGRWTLVREMTREGVTRWKVFPADRPELEREVVARDGAELEVRIAHPGTVEQMIDRIGVSAPRGAVLAGVPYQLSVAGWNRAGRRVHVPEVGWSIVSGDGVVDSAGVLVVGSVGAVTVRVTAGGWRTADARIVASAPVVETAMTEEWRGEPFTRWVPYGAPRPAIVTARARPAFHINGDESYHSGAYSRVAFDGTRGLALDFEVSTPLTLTQWQILHVMIVQLRDRSTLSRWDHVTGYFGEHMRNPCAFSFPVGEGAGAAERVLWINDLREAAGDPGLRLDDGRWYRVRLQLFPDGRCGLAVDGHPLRISRSHPPAPDSLHVVIEGHSHETMMVVGGLRVTAGVPRDIEWTSLRYDGAAWVRRRGDAGHPARAPIHR